MMRIREGFISEDPGGDPNNPNLYTYCANNPLRFVDSTGLEYSNPGNVSSITAPGYGYDNGNGITGGNPGSGGKQRTDYGSYGYDEYTDGNGNVHRDWFTWGEGYSHFEITERLTILGPSTQENVNPSITPFDLYVTT